MGDVFFDLANFSINHSFDEDAQAQLLEAYFGSVRPEHTRALTLMRFMSDFREAMWGVVQNAVSSLDFDFSCLRGRALRATRAHCRRGRIPRRLGLGGRACDFVAEVSSSPLENR